MDNKKPDYEKVFYMFCTAAELREQLRSPFKQRNIYASTDAFSMIYMPTSVADLDFKEQYETDVSRVIPLILHEEIALDVKELGDAIKENTPMIDHWKTINTTCVECGGGGEISCNLDHLHDCLTCKGSGEISEKRLEEFKIPDEKTLFKFNGMEDGDTGFHYKQLTRLVSAAKELNVKTIYKVYGKNKTPHVFNVGETSIMIMPAITTGNQAVRLPFDFHYIPEQ
jgi:hypothetical protein